MKKIALILGMMICMGVSAQDTIVSRDLNSRYFCNLCPMDEYEYAMIGWYPADTNMFIYFAKRMYAPDTITVYGIAVAYLYVEGLEPDSDLQLGNEYDTSRDNAYEYFALYKDAVGIDSLVCFSDSLLIHAYYTPVAYYQDMGVTQPPQTCHHLPAFYEKYFDTPYQVQGRFYVVRTNRSWTHSYYDSINDRTYSREKKEVILARLLMIDPKTGIEIPQFDTVTTKIHSTGGWDPVFQIMFPDTVKWIVQGEPWVVMTFPIIDTVGYSGNNAVNGVMMADRFVTLAPNPANRKVTVTATCGMTRLTVYGPIGERVLDMDVSGVSAALDVSGWPPGCYVVHIETLFGTAIKKLVVQ